MNGYLDERSRTLNNDPRCAFTSRKGLFALLAQYRAWAKQGLSDTAITAAIRGWR